MKQTAYRGKGSGKKWLAALLALVGLGIVLLGALEIYIAVHSRDSIVGEPEVMVVFGCQVKPDGPSVLLRDRLDAALGYWEEHPDIKIVVTGGKGTTNTFPRPSVCTTTSLPTGWTGRRSTWRTSPGTPGRM